MQLCAIGGGCDLICLGLHSAGFSIIMFCSVPEDNSHVQACSSMNGCINIISYSFSLYGHTGLLFQSLWSGEGLRESLVINEIILQAGWWTWSSCLLGDLAFLVTLLLLILQNFVLWVYAVQSISFGRRGTIMMEMEGISWWPSQQQQQQQQKCSIRSLYDAGLIMTDDFSSSPFSGHWLVGNKKAVLGSK